MIETLDEPADYPDINSVDIVEPTGYAGEGYATEGEEEPIALVDAPPVPVAAPAAPVAAPAAAPAAPAAAPAAPAAAPAAPAAIPAAA